MPLQNVKSSEMQYISKKSEESSVQSASNCANTHQLWWNSSASNYPPAFPKNLYMKVGSLACNASQLKHLGEQIADQESSSTQSTGQSHQEVSDSSEGNVQEQCISAQSGMLIHDVIFEATCLYMRTLVTCFFKKVFLSKFFFGETYAWWQKILILRVT